jgi:hypothetical protein
MKKNHSHATPLRACEVKTGKAKKGNNGVSRKPIGRTLGQVAFEAFHTRGIKWETSIFKPEWERTAQAVADEIIRRVEAKYK